MISRRDCVQLGTLWTQGAILSAFSAEEGYTVQCGNTLSVSDWKEPDLRGPSVPIRPTGHFHFRRLNRSMPAARTSLNWSRSSRNASTSIFPIRL
jgi:hypothetical protein